MKYDHQSDLHHSFGYTCHIWQDLESIICVYMTVCTIIDRSIEHPLGLVLFKIFEDWGGGGNREGRLIQESDLEQGLVIQRWVRIRLNFIQNYFI